MRRQLKLRNLICSVSLLCAGLLVGCSADSIGPDTAATGSDNYTKMDFSAPYGGLTTSDELEGFGDASLLAMSSVADGDAVIDPLDTDPAVLAMEAQARVARARADSTRPRVTFVHLRWGLLRSFMDSVAVDSTCDLTDWSGSLTVDRGVLRIRRVFRFERPGDHIVFPRPDRQTAELVSWTGCGVDGILLQIMERPGDYASSDSTVQAPNYLHINLGPYQAAFMMSELAGLQTVVDVGALGNKIGIVGFTPRDLSACSRGFLRGHFRPLPAGRRDSLGTGPRGEQYGVFAGTWGSLAGRLNGYLRGGYGVDANGRRIFVGKYVSPVGRFRGLIRGTWEPGTASDAMGRFQGHWVSRNGDVEGGLGGNTFPVGGRPGGLLRGRWEALCGPTTGGTP